MHMPKEDTETEKGERMDAEASGPSDAETRVLFPDCEWPVEPFLTTAVQLAFLQIGRAHV